MPNVFGPEDLEALHARCREAGGRFAAAYPGERADRQPVHTVYGGAHLFRADLTGRLGAAALASLDVYASDPAAFARAIGLEGDAGLARTVHARVVEKLRREPVEDYRIDFEDGYGHRLDAEEDAHAGAVAVALAEGMKAATLPPFIGIRVKPLSEELAGRALRTLDLVLSELLPRTSGALPPNFVVTLPKVTDPPQVEVVADALERIERAHGIAAGSIPIELMVETPQSVFGPRGDLALPKLVAAARGRCRGAHFGTYDYTASLGITARHQVMHHPACAFARHVMQVSLSGTGVWLSDGSTTLMPVGPHRAEPGGPPLTAEQLERNLRTVHEAWRAHYRDVRQSLMLGYYQGWDLNPGQLPTRYAAVYSFFLEARAEAAARLQRFVERAAQATLLGNIFDDAATGQGLLNFFLRGLNCGALTEDEALATGLTLAEIRGRSFARILDARRGA